jgi:AraC-like DNA-binding protein
MGLPPFTYLTRSPVGPLRRCVESVWFARGTLPADSERVAPTGSTVLGIVLGDPITQTPRNGTGEPFDAVTGFLIGPHDQPIVNRPSAETWCVGIVTTPVGARAALRVDPLPLRGRVVGAELWPRFVEVRTHLTAITDPQTMLGYVEQVLAEGLSDDDPWLAICDDAVTLLTAAPTRPIARIAAELGVSHGHLDRAFRRVVGFGPRTLARILRLRRLLAGLDLAGLDVHGPVAWTRLAADLGWYDQAHLIRDFKRFTGVTPSAYVAAYRAVYASEPVTPGFTPSIPSNPPGPPRA